MEQRVVTHHSARLVRTVVLAFIDGVVHMSCDAGFAGARGYFDQVDSSWRLEEAERTEACYLHEHV